MKPLLGLDVGGTKIASGLIDQNYKISNVLIRPTSQTNLVHQLEQIIKIYNGKFSGIGLGMPGRVLTDGTIIRLPNIPRFKKANLKNLFQKKFQVPVAVTNDAKSFALAESIFGQGKNFQKVAGVILGTGIGMGMVIDKKIFFGANGLAGEIGHFVLPNGKIFEKYFKSKRQIKNATQIKPQIAMLLNFIVRSFDPEAIIFGGSMSKIPQFEKVAKIMLKTIYHSPLKTKIFISKLPHPGIIGACIPLLRHKT